MKPFSPVYFIKENKMRCGLLILMFVLTYISYLGGLYVTNITTMYDYNIDARRNYSIITPAETDDEYKEFEAAKSCCRATIFQPGGDRVRPSLYFKKKQKFLNGIN